MIEGARELPDFVLLRHVGLMIKIAGFRNLLRYLHQLIQRDGDCARRFIRNPDAKADRQQGAESGDRDRIAGHVLVGLAAIVDNRLVFAIRDFKVFGRILQPCGGVFLEVKNL